MSTTTIVFVLCTAIASFANGYIFCDSFEKLYDERIWTGVKIFVLYGIFGFVVIGLAIIFGLIANIVNRIMQLFQIKFWWGWHVTGKYDNLSEERLEAINLNAKAITGIYNQKRQVLSLNVRHFLYCFKLIRKKYKKEKEWSWIDNPDNFVKK